MILRVFRSLWGLEADLRSPKAIHALLTSIKASGVFSGVELSLGDACMPFESQAAITAPALKQFASIVNDVGLDVIPGVYSSWQDYGGSGWEDIPVRTHVDNFTRQCEAILSSGIKPVLINAHSGSDSWTEAEAVEYFQQVLELEKCWGVTISHETHRARYLSSPWATERLLQCFPQLSITADVSHWTIACERLLVSPREKRLLSTVANHVKHIHGRVGGPQSPQLDQSLPLSPRDRVGPERSFFEEFWSNVWSARRAAGDSLTTFTPEYGPIGSGYATLGSSAEVNGVIVGEGRRQSRRFRVFERAEQLRDETAVPKPVAYPSSLPLVDVSALYDENASPAALASTATQVHNACIQHGFMYIKGHGIPAPLVDSVLEGTREFFFSTPQSVKDSIALRLNPTSGRGYQRFAENITYGSVDLHEGVDFLRDYETEPEWVSLLSGAPSVYKDIVMGRNVWPPSPPHLHADLQVYVAHMIRVGKGLMRALAVGLGLPINHFEPSAQEPYWSMRMIGYPSVTTAADVLARRPPADDTVSANSVGCGEHCDYGCWTLLAVDPHVNNALQVRNAGGLWVSADPIPGALVVNIGDLLSLWSGGMYQSTPHRVLNHMHLSRVSVPFFFDPNFASPAATLPEVSRMLLSRTNPDPALQARLNAVKQRMGIQDDTQVLFGQYHLKKVSTNFLLS